MMKAQDIHQLQALLPGAVALPGDEVYQKASKMMVCTIAPGAVVRPTSSEEVAKVIRFIKTRAIPFAIRGGGHSNIPLRLADGILLIDMSGLAAVEVTDPSQCLVRVGGGALWREVAGELEKHGLGISSGDTGGVGVGGLSTGAGIGWMMRKHGPVVDNTVALEVVTADGSIVRASKDNHPDLFWAVRGGGSNFGIVTAFTFKAHPVAGVFHGSILYPLEDVGGVIKRWRDAMRQAPPELTTMLITSPARRGNAASIEITGCFEGADKSAADRAFAPFLSLGNLVSQNIAAKAYKDVLEDCDTLSPGMRVIGYTTFIKALSTEVVDAIAALYPEPAPILQIRHVAGAMNRWPADATAFGYRDAEVLIVNPNLVPLDASEADIHQATAPWRAIKPLGQGPYLNLTSEDTGAEVAEAYPPAILKRLQKVKAQYDPDNIFTANFNITPQP